MTRIRERMHASVSDATAVTRYISDRLSARLSTQRKKARVLLAALASQANGDWLDGVMQTSAFSNPVVEAVLQEALGRSLLVETDVRVAVRCVRFLQQRLDFQTPTHSENVPISLAILLCQRSVMREQLLSCKEAADALFQLFLSHLRTAASRNHRVEHSKASQLVALRWSTALTSERKSQMLLHRHVLRATLLLLTLTNSARNALACFFLPADGTGQPPMAFAVTRPNAHADVLKVCSFVVSFDLFSLI